MIRSRDYKQIKVSGSAPGLSFAEARGFTLLEMIISLGIIALISTIILTGFHANQRQQAVIAEAENLAAKLRETQGKALHGVQSGSQVPSGYGAYFNPAGSSGQYYIFADANGDNLYQAGELKETIILNNKVIISGASPNPASLVFQPPFAKFYLNGAYDAGSTTSITLREKNGTFQKTVIVNNLGGNIYIN